LNNTGFGGVVVFVAFAAIGFALVRVVMGWW
jgi:hypothetical protein